MGTKGLNKKILEGMNDFLIECPVLILIKLSLTLALGYKYLEFRQMHFTK